MHVDFARTAFALLSLLVPLRQPLATELPPAPTPVCCILGEWNCYGSTHFLVTDPGESGILWIRGHYPGAATWTGSELRIVWFDGGYVGLYRLERGELVGTWWHKDSPGRKFDSPWKR
jgi:hypothetical protein